VANVVVVVEVQRGRPLPVSLETLGQARRLSTQLGATLYAVLPLAEAPQYGDDDLIAELARHGADKVVVVTDAALGGRAGLRWDTHGPALASVNELVPASILLFGATAGAREVAARLAARLGAAYLAEAWLEIEEDRLTLWEGSGENARSLDGDLEFPVVATVPPGRYAPGAGDEEAEVEVVPVGARPAGFEDLGVEPAPTARVVAEGSDEAAAKLAAALGGEVRSGEGTAMLAVSLGPGFDGLVAEARVALGDGVCRADAHYALDGDAARLAAELAALVAEAG
jgi:electron transfer flavoprotein alpha subunit